MFKIRKLWRRHKNIPEIRDLLLDLITSDEDENEIVEFVREAFLDLLPSLEDGLLRLIDQFGDWVDGQFTWKNIKNDNLREWLELHDNPGDWEILNRRIRWEIRFLRRRLRGGRVTPGLVDLSRGYELNEELREAGRSRGPFDGAPVVGRKDLPMVLHRQRLDEIARLKEAIAALEAEEPAPEEVFAEEDLMEDEEDLAPPPPPEPPAPADPAILLMEPLSLDEKGVPDARDLPDVNERGRRAVAANPPRRKRRPAAQRSPNTLSGPAGTGAAPIMGGEG